MAAAGSTTGALLIRPLAGVDLVTASAWHIVLGGTVLAAVAATVEGAPRITWQPRFVASLLFLSLIAKAVAFLLWFEDARRAPLASLSTWTLLVPVVGALIGVVLLDERLCARQLAGLALMVASVGAVQARQQRDTDPFSGWRRVCARRLTRGTR